MLDFGIDIGWNDNNEYGMMDDDAQCAGFGVPIPMHRARPLHSLLMCRTSFEAQAANGIKENFTVTRAGGPGIQRYAQTWSGDNTTSWHTLKWNIRTGLQMSLSGLFNIGHDVGGFYGPVPEPELFVRWVQACCLNPRMVMNSWKAGNVSNVPWMHAEVTPLVVAAIRLRYRLLPYLWAQFERATLAHCPIIRPTFYDFPDDEACFEDCDAFMVGPDILCAPVLAQGQTQLSVYLPKLADGALWHGLESGLSYASGRTHVIDVTLASIPLFVRAGARIPVVEVADDVMPNATMPANACQQF